MTIETTNLLIDKARSKRDGIYSYKVFNYVVKNGVFLAYREKITGRIFERAGAFNIELGKGTLIQLKDMYL